MQSEISTVFLDRDGTINEDAGYTSDPGQLHVIPGVAEAIRSLNERSIPVIVVTNQGGVAHGHHTEDDVNDFHKALSSELQKSGAHIDGFYYCPHHPDGKGEYKKVCDCRKPMPGLLKQAAKEMGIELSRSVMIGDKARDIGAGRAVGCRTVLVKTGHGEKEWAAWHEDFKPDHVARDLAEAIAWLLESK